MVVDEWSEGVVKMVLKIKVFLIMEFSINGVFKILLIKVNVLGFLFFLNVDVLFFVGILVEFIVGKYF